MHVVELWAPNIDPTTESMLAYAYTKAGYQDKAEENLSLLLKGVERNPAWACTIAATYSVLGDKEKAFIWLEKGFREHSGGILLYLGVEFAYDNIRADPRFDAFLVKIGLKKLPQIEARQLEFDIQPAKRNTEEKTSLQSPMPLESQFYPSPTSALILKTSILRTA